MKGGYQIIDLSGATVDDSVTIEGAFSKAKGNNGKVVMIITPDEQRVFAQADEVNGSYVASYLGADGKNYGIVISNADSVTITASDVSGDVGAVEQEVNAIAARLDANITLETEDNVIISSYTSDNKYTTPTDGYLYLDIPAGTPSSSTIAVCYCNGRAMFKVEPGSVANNCYTTFVKKGSQIHSNASTNSWTLTFCKTV